MIDEDLYDATDRELRTLFTSELHAPDRLWELALERAGRRRRLRAMVLDRLQPRGPVRPRPLAIAAALVVLTGALGIVAGARLSGSGGADQSGSAAGGAGPSGSNAAPEPTFGDVVNAASGMIWGPGPHCVGETGGGVSGRGMVIYLEQAPRVCPTAAAPGDAKVSENPVRTAPASWLTQVGPGRYVVDVDACWSGQAWQVSMTAGSHDDVTVQSVTTKVAWGKAVLHSAGGSCWPASDGQLSANAKAFPPDPASSPVDYATGVIAMGAPASCRNSVSDGTASSPSASRPGLVGLSWFPRQSPYATRVRRAPMACGSSGSPDSAAPGTYVIDLDDCTYHVGTEVTVVVAADGTEEATAAARVPYGQAQPHGASCRPAS